MAKQKDLSELTDQELMDAWDVAGEQGAVIRDQLKAFAAEHQRRLTAANEAAAAEKQARIESGEHDASLDQVIGRI